MNDNNTYKLTCVIPCYNEERTLEVCLDRVEKIADEHLELECIIVDDNSSDRSQQVAEHLMEKYDNIIVLRHDVNQGKGAALQTGFKHATGDFVAVQDADLEYDPFDLKRLLQPLIENNADVVLGSRFLTGGAHRVLYFWHSIGNSLLTLLSNMLTDVNLTDMETCYKVFKREVIQSIELKEKRFGFEPEVVAKIAQKRLRVYEMGISYYGRTYEEGKKITMKDTWRAFYCILKYNLNKVPWIMQFIFYLIIGSTAAILNLIIFITIYSFTVPLWLSTGVSFILAAVFNYILCILILFRHRAKWHSVIEVFVFLFVVIIVGTVDYMATSYFIRNGIHAGISKMIASVIGLVLNFSGRKWLVFPEQGNTKWEPQNKL